MQPIAASATLIPARNPQLWQLAKCRAKFQRHLLAYLVVNAGLWALYFLLPEAPGPGHYRELPWPVWTSLFWGIGLVGQGLRAYAGLTCGVLAQREYERLLGQPAR